MSILFWLLLLAYAVFGVTDLLTVPAANAGNGPKVRLAILVIILTIFGQKIYGFPWE